MIRVSRDIMERTLGKIKKLHLISLCGNFVEKHSFRRVSGDAETVPFRKISTAENCVKFRYYTQWKIELLKKWM